MITCQGNVAYYIGMQVECLAQLVLRTKHGTYKLNIIITAYLTGNDRSSRFW